MNPHGEGKTRYAMVMDTRLCLACQACVQACVKENALPDGCFRDRVVQETVERSPRPLVENRSERCNHCANPPCVTACPEGAGFIGEGGAVQVQQELCTGCGACIEACPYDAVYLHPSGYADRCTLCLHRVHKGLAPACVSVCPTNALIFGDLGDPRSPVSRLLATREHRVLLPERGCGPHGYFLS